MGYRILALQKRSPGCKKLRWGSPARLINPARKRLEPDRRSRHGQPDIVQIGRRVPSAVGAGAPQHVEGAAVIEPTAEHEEVVGEAVQIFERFGVDRLAAG